ncbi:MAG: ATP-NAD kinase, partial [Haloplanus sp.]
LLGSVVVRTLAGEGESIFEGVYAARSRLDGGPGTMAEAYGVAGERVSDPDDLTGALETAIGRDDQGAVAFDAGSGGAAVYLRPPDDAVRTVRAVVAPGVTATVGIDRHRRLDADEPARFEVPDGVIGADGERELELVDAQVELVPRESGPLLVDVRAALDRAARAGALTIDTTP